MWIGIATQVESIECDSNLFIHISFIVGFIWDGKFSFSTRYATFGRKNKLCLLSTIIKRSLDQDSLLSRPMPYPLGHGYCRLFFSLSFLV